MSTISTNSMSISPPTVAPPNPLPAASADNVATPAAASAPPQPKPYLTIRRTSGWAAVNLRELWHFRDLMFTLAGRDLKLRYKQTALGVAWVVLQPLMAAGIFSFVFGTVAKMPSDGRPYFVFAFAGMLGWNLFSATLTKCSGCLVGNAHLISKVFFPRLVLPLSTVPSTLVDFAVSMGMMAVLLIVYQVPPSMALLMLPVWLFLLAALALGIGLCAAALTVNYRDVQYILPVFLQVLLYASPIAYPLAAVPANLRAWYGLNPLVSLLEGVRWSLLGTATPDWMQVGGAAVLSLVALLGGAFSFKRMERRFADVI